MSILLILMVLATLAGLGVFILLRFLRGVQPTGAEIDEDLKALKGMVSSFKGGFVPWSEDISANELDQILERNNTRSGNGVFLDTLGQPIFAYAFRKYIGPGRNDLVYILTADKEYVFRTTTKGTEVSINGRPYGLIRRNGVLYDVYNKEQAKVERLGATSTHKIFIGEREVAKVALPDAMAGSKALDVAAKDVEPADYEKIRLFTVYELVASIGDLEA